MRTVASDSGNLSAMDVTQSQGGRGQVATLNHPTQGGYAYHNGQRSQSSNQKSESFRLMALASPYHDVPISETDKNPTKFLLNLYKQVK